MRFFIILVVGLWLVSCSSSGKRTEAYTKLSDTSMVKILIELHMLDATIPYIFPTPNSPEAKAAFQQLRQEIFARHQVDSAQFYQVYQAYLTQDIARLNRLYEQVVDSLSLYASTRQFILWEAKLRPTKDSIIVIDSLFKSVDSLQKKPREVIRRRKRDFSKQNP